MRTMSDFESRVRNALGAGAERAPAAVGLAEGARSRLRRRRRTTGAVAATAVVLAGVPLGIALLGGGDSAPDGRDDVTAADELPTVPGGWRWESWRDVQVAVPGEWTEGAASQYCISPTPGVGVVDRGDGISTMVACEHAVGPGVVFREGLAKHPLDAEGVAERLTFGENTVDVIAADQETLDAIVTSAHRFETADSRGCAPAFDADTVMSDEGEYVALPGSGVVSVCEYTGLVEGDRTTYTLNESRTLSEKASGALLAAIAAAPEGSSGECTSGPNGEEPEPWARAVEVRTEDGRVAATTAASCQGTPLRTGEGEFDGAELMLATTDGGDSVSSSEVMPAP